MVMATTTRTQHRYDQRLRELVRTTQDVSYAVQYGVPRSTARSWLTAPSVQVVTVNALKMDAIQLQREVLRRILAWKVTPTFDPGATAEILLTASKGVDHGVPTVLTDGGVENFNGAVDELIHSGLLHRALGPARKSRIPIP